MDPKEVAEAALYKFMHDKSIQALLAPEFKEREVGWLRAILKGPKHRPDRKAGAPASLEMRRSRDVELHRNEDARGLSFEDTLPQLIKATKDDEFQLEGGAAEGCEMELRATPGPFANASQDVKGVEASIWARILKQLPPWEIRKMRQVCRSLQKIIDDDDSILRESREKRFGRGLQNVPSGVSEFAFSVLLDSKVCQACGVGYRQGQNPRTMWGFLRKWCGRCFELQNRVAGDFQKCEPLVAEFGLECVNEILTTLPFEYKDSYGGISCLGILEAQKILQLPPGGYHKAFRISDFVRVVRILDQIKLVTERYDAVKDEAPNQGTMKWFELRGLVAQFEDYIWGIQSSEADARMYWALRTENIVLGTEYEELPGRRRQPSREATVLARVNAVNDARLSAAIREDGQVGEFELMTTESLTNPGGT